MRQESYDRIAIAGMVMFIPVMMAVGPLSGYMVGGFIQERFHAPWPVMAISIGLGFVAGIMEVIKIVRKITAIINKETKTTRRHNV